MSSTSITPITLTGTSQYASTYQSILTQAVQVAQIPVTALQTRDSNILSNKTLLAGLSSAVGNLASDLQSLGTTAASGALTANSSDSSTVSVSDTGATAAASYTINSVTSVASAASEVSTNSYSDATSTAINSTGALSLVVGSKTYNISLTSSTNNLSGLESAINGLGAGVTASILTTGNGDYLSVSANNTGATTLQLNDNSTGTSTDLLTAKNQGTNAVFQLNGINVSQPNNTVSNVIPGLTFTIGQPSTSPVTISLQGDASQLSSTLTSFVSDFNAVQQLVTAQEGPGAGGLSGSNIISGLQNTLNQIASFHFGTGSVNNLSNLGVSFSSTGSASFDPTVLSSFSSSQLSSALTFLGSASSGLAQFAGSVSAFSDPVSGFISVEQASINTEDQQLQAEITTKTAQINAMQTSLSQQLAKADAEQSMLQSQQTELTASLQGLNVVLYGKAAGS